MPLAPISRKVLTALRRALGRLALSHNGKKRGGLAFAKPAQCRIIANFYVSPIVFSVRRRWSVQILVV